MIMVVSLLELIEKYQKTNNEHLSKSDIVSVKQFIKRNEKQMKEEVLIEKIEQFILKRKRKQKNKQNNYVLASIKENDKENNYYLICQDLQINYRRVMQLSSRGYKKRDLIIYTWYYYDKSNNKGEKVLSLKKLREITSVSFLENNTRIIDHIVSYKVGRVKSLTSVFDLEKEYYLKMIKKILTKYKMLATQDILDDVLDECYIFLHEKLVKRIVLKENDCVKKYISKSIEGRIKNYIKELYQNENEMLLDERLLNKNRTINPSENPLSFLIKKEEKEDLYKTYHSLNPKDQAIIYDMYLKDNSVLSFKSILTGEMNGYDIHESIGKFQEAYFKLINETI